MTLGEYDVPVINSPLWDWMVLVVQAEPMWDQGIDGKSLPFSQFCYEPKTSLKNKVFNN